MQAFVRTEFGRQWPPDRRSVIRIHSRPRGQNIVSSLNGGGRVLAITGISRNRSPGRRLWLTACAEVKEIMENVAELAGHERSSVRHRTSRFALPSFNDDVIILSLTGGYVESQRAAFEGASGQR